MNNQEYLLVLSGPSGCGKDTVLKNLIEQHPGIEHSVSATTRQPREGDRHGVDYYFISKEEFENHIANNGLLEYTQYIGEYYGTLRSEVDNRIEKGITCVLVIEVEGAANVKKIYPGCTTVFILPPSMEELERRLRGRASEGEDRVLKRLERAREEMKCAGSYDYQIVNDDAQVCADEIYEILRQRQKA